VASAGVRSDTSSAVGAQRHLKCCRVIFRSDTSSAVGSSFAMSAPSTLFLLQHCWTSFFAKTKAIEEIGDDISAVCDGNVAASFCGSLPGANDLDDPQTLIPAPNLHFYGRSREGIRDFIDSELYEGRNVSQKKFRFLSQMFMVVTGTNLQSSGLTGSKLSYRCRVQNCPFSVHAEPVKLNDQAVYDCYSILPIQLDHSHAPLPKTLKCPYGQSQFSTLLQPFLLDKPLALPADCIIHLKSYLIGLTDFTSKITEGLGMARKACLGNASSFQHELRPLASALHSQEHRCDLIEVDSKQVLESLDNQTVALSKRIKTAPGKGLSQAKQSAMQQELKELGQFRADVKAKGSQKYLAGWVLIPRATLLAWPNLQSRVWFLDACHVFGVCRGVLYVICTLDSNEQQVVLCIAYFAGNESESTPLPSPPSLTPHFSFCGASFCLTCT